jgi:hypothetical protein
MAKVNPIFKESIPCELDMEEIAGFNPEYESDLNVARKDKFILVIDLPNSFRKLENKGLTNCTYFKKNKLQMNVFGNIVPETEIESLNIAGWGHNVKSSAFARPAYKPITVEFTVDSKYENYFVIYKWLDIMSDVMEGTFDANREIDRFGKLKDYSTTFSLYALDEYNKPVVRWNYYGSFPTTLGSITYNKRDVAELESEFIFEFSFLKMELL